MPSAPKLSPVIQNLIDKGLLDRLPPTFSTFFFEQFQDWNLLFPAERNYQERMFTLLDRSQPAAVESLFAPVREVERRMGVDEKTWPRRHFGLEQVDFLNRNPHFAEWRQAISRVFAKVDPLLDAEVTRKGKPSLIIVTAPSELSADPSRMWLRLSRYGKRIQVDVPDGADYLNLAVTGGTRKSILEMYSKEPYDSWMISADNPWDGVRNAIRLKYDDLKDYRSRMMDEVRRMLESGEVRTPRELNERLKRLKIRASEGDLASDEILSEFLRAVLLAGNGTLLINNTFVEWATIQAIRRARPSMMIISFGIRNKLKPFSSVLIYSDQEATNPIPSQMDALGTYVDLEIFYQYIWQEFQKYAQYRNNTAFLFLADGMEELFCIAPPDFPLLTAKAPVKLTEVFGHAREWLNI
ncbi:MAG: hypothetical protein ABSB35_15690 [Bryobacteraceae bacterium]|jgi:hypothetical protein